MIQVDGSLDRSLDGLHSPDGPTYVSVNGYEQFCRFNSKGDEIIVEIYSNGHVLCSTKHGVAGVFFTTVVSL